MTSKLTIIGRRGIDTLSPKLVEVTISSLGMYAGNKLSYVKLYPSSITDLTTTTVRLYECTYASTTNEKLYHYHTKS